MNIENELKLIPGKGIIREQIVEKLRTKRFDVPEQGKIGHQEDTYFDDKNGSLEKSGGSFRIRRKQGKTQVTYKIPIESNTEYKQRKEYEIVVPKEYEPNLDMDLAIKLLKEQYPELVFPENMGEVLTVINDRNKTNITCPDGTVLEMAFDRLQGRDAQGNLYHIQPEIEFETISGNPDNLTTVYETVLKEFPGQTHRNTLSKYARTKSEIDARKLTLEEVTACAMLSEILKSEQFAKLEYKGQVLHKHDKPVLTNLNNFKDFYYLVETVRKIKSGEYKVAIPRAVAEKEGMESLLEGENYEVKDDINLEEMVGLLLSDVKYSVAAEVLEDVLNTKFYGKENPITNRLNHSQQIMLFSGLIAKSTYVDATFEERLTSMIAALAHDIGHVPMAHNLEAVLKDIDGIFSHEVNGKITLDNIYEQTEERMLESIQEYLPSFSQQEIEEALVNKTAEIKSGIMNHSRKGAEHREQGIVQQAARLADKMYAISDIRDFEQQMEIKVMDENWIKEAFMAAYKGNEQLAEEVKSRLDKTLLQNIKDGNYGRAAINIINTVHRHEDGVIYDVDQDVWAFMNVLINRVKEIRIKSGVEKDKSAMTDAAEILIDEWICEEYMKANGDAGLAWKNLLRRITCTGELEIRDFLKEAIADIKNGKEAEEQVNSQEVDKDKIIDYMKGKLSKAYRIKGQRKAEQEGMTDDEAKKYVQEYAQTEVEKIVENLKGLTQEELITNFSRFFSPGIKNGVLAKRIRTEVHDLADVQLKIKPEQRNFFERICNKLGISSNQNPTRKYIEDEYYLVNQNGVVNPNIKTRVRTEGKKRTLTVKIPVGKKVSERIERSYTYTQKDDEPDLTVEELLQRLKQKHPGIDIELCEDKPIDTIEITRMEHCKTYKGYSVVIVEDSFNGKDGKEHKEIEIKCPENPPIVTKIKETLKGEFAKNFITDSKIDRVQGDKNKGMLHGE